jgi:hypothetical protein
MSLEKRQVSEEQSGLGRGNTTRASTMFAYPCKIVTVHIQMTEKFC